MQTRTGIALFIGLAIAVRFLMGSQPSPPRTSVPSPDLATAPPSPWVSELAALVAGRGLPAPESGDEWTRRQRVFYSLQVSGFGDGGRADLTRSTAHADAWELTAEHWHYAFEPSEIGTVRALCGDGVTVYSIESGPLAGAFMEDSAIRANSGGGAVVIASKAMIAIATDRTLEYGMRRCLIGKGLL